MPSYLPATGPNDKRADLPGQPCHPEHGVVVLVVEVIGGLKVLLVHLNCPGVDGLELPLFGP